MSKVETTVTDTTCNTWSWRDADVGDRPESLEPRFKRLLVESLVGWGVGALIILFTRKDEMGVFVICVAAAVLLTGLFYRPGYRAFHEFFQLIGKLVGILVTWLLLAPFFLIFFTAGRLVLTMMGKDPMRRGFPTDEKTYWEPRERAEAERYLKQY